MKILDQLSYLGSIKPTCGIFYFLEGDKKWPIPIHKTSMRGLKSSYKEGYAEDKNKANPHALTQSNIVTADFCMPPASVNEVFCDFSLRISANTLTPETCYGQETQSKLINFVETYAQLDGFSVLARRIAKNILMGTWLFRNKEKQPSISVTLSKGTKYLIQQSNALDWEESTWKKTDINTLNKLTAEIASALVNKTLFWQAKISACLSVAPCEELFPSQLMDTKNRDKKLSSVRFDHERETAALTPQKIGAALAMIDDWYAKDAKPIRVTEYGGDKAIRFALRHPSTKLDFYTQLTNLDKQQKILNSAKNVTDITNNIHYLMSVLLKGGLFSKKDE